MTFTLLVHENGDTLSNYDHISLEQLDSIVEGFYISSHLPDLIARKWKLQEMLKRNQERIDLAIQRGQDQLEVREMQEFMRSLSSDFIEE